MIFSIFAFVYMEYNLLNQALVGRNIFKAYSEGLPWVIKAFFKIVFLSFANNFAMAPLMIVLCTSFENLSDLDVLRIMSLIINIILPIIALIIFRGDYYIDPYYEDKLEKIQRRGRKTCILLIITGLVVLCCSFMYEGELMEGMMK